MRLVWDVVKLYFGLFLYAFGMVLGYQAQFGYAPWDVFHVGVSLRTGITVGQATILIGFLVLLLVTLLKEPFGFGTVSNMIFVGIFFDLILSTGLIPASKSLPLSLLYTLIAMIIISFATYYYISSGFGAGPRDSLMVLIHRRTGLSLGTVRRLIEILVTFLGWLMGGRVWIGTLVFALFTGTMMNVLFPLLGFNPKEIKHRSFFKRKV